MPFSIRSSRMVYLKPGVLKAVAEIDKSYLISRNALNPGLKGLYKVPVDSNVKTIIFASIVLSYFCVLVDFTIAICSDVKTDESMGPMDRGTFKELIYCFDFIFMAEVMLMICRKKNNIFPNRHSLLIIVEVLSIIPYEMMYVIFKGTSLRLFYGFRLRYALRFVRFIVDEFIKTSKINFDVNLCLLKYLLFSAIICMSAVSMRLYYWCSSSTRNHEPQIINCSRISLFEFSFTYAILNGQITYSAALYSGSQYAFLPVFDGIFHLLMFFFACLVVPKGICIFLQNFAPKYEFATVCSQVLRQIETVKRHRNPALHTTNEEVVGHKTWTFRDDRFVKTAKSYMVDYWRMSTLNWRKDAEDYQEGGLPDVLKNEITIDVRWNMFKHSLLFRNESTAFLRALAQKSEFCFCMEGDKLCDLLEYRSSMVYIVCGTMCLTSEEDQYNPIISFSGGTCFGELNLFLATPSRTKIQCKTYCEYLRLNRVDFMTIRRSYPEVYQKLRVLALKRIHQAKVYHHLCRRLYENKVLKVPKSEMSLRYIKLTMKKLTDKRASEKDKMLEKMFENYNYRSELESTVFNATYLPLYVMSRDQGLHIRTHFLRAGYNFKLHPESSLLGIWRCFIHILIITFNVAYPFGLTLEDPLLGCFYDYFMIVVGVCWIFDFVSFNFVGYRNRDKVHSSSFDIMINRFNRMEVWLDAVSSTPVAVLLEMLQGPGHYYTFRLLGFNYLLKTYKLESYLKEKVFFNVVHLLLLEVGKMIYLMTFLFLLAYAIFYRYDYFSKYGDGSSNFEGTTLFIDRLSLVVQFLFSTADALFLIDRNTSLVPLIVVQYLCYYFIQLIFCLAPAAASLAHSPVIQFENMVEDFNRLFTLHKFKAVPKRKLNRFMHLHHDADRGRHIFGDVYIRRMLGTSLYKMKRHMEVCWVFESHPLLMRLPARVAHEIAEVGEMVYIPRGEVVCLSGSLVREMYILMMGHCAYVLPPQNVTEGMLGPGESIFLVEALYNLLAVHNVVAITDCKLWCIPCDELNRKLTMFPEQLEVIYRTLHETIRPSVVEKMQRPEIIAYDDQGSLISIGVAEGKSHHYQQQKQQQVLNFKYYVMRIFMHQHIPPYSTFWFCWELKHMVVVYLYSLLGTVPVTYHYSYLTVSFWLFRVFDFELLLDMYLRHFLIYFNGYGIEVHRTWKTACHYWRTSFIVDLVGLLPLELMILPTMGDVYVSTMFWLRLNKYFLLYRMIGIRNYINGNYMWEFRMAIMVYSIAWILLAFNMLQVALLYRDCRVVVLSDGVVDVCGFNGAKFWLDYLWRLRIALEKNFNLGIYGGTRSPSVQLWRYSLMCALGFVASIGITSVLTAFSLFRNSHLTTYQIKMQRLVKFMNMRKIDKGIRTELIKHYEYLWTLREGKTLKFLLKLFSRSSYEETMYGYFAPHVERTILFSGFPKVVVKELICSQKMSRRFTLRRGIVMRINDVQDKLVIIQKGTIEVLGPDYTFLRRLYVGSIFGCLDDVDKQRTTLTYVAQTHCELLTVTARDFHGIIRKFPRFYRHYQFLVRSSNIDYVPSFGIFKPDQKTGEKTGGILIKEGRSSLATNEHFPTGFSMRSSMQQGTFKKSKPKHGWKLFKVVKPNGIRTLCFVIYCYVAFMFESFQLNVKVSKDNYVLPFFAYVMDFVFWVKIYMDFSTSYEDLHGFSVTARNLIAKRYIRDYRPNGFFFHLICNLPIEVFVMVLPETTKRRTLWKQCRCNRLLKILIVFSYLRWARNRLNINVQLIRCLYIMLVACAIQQLSMIFMTYFMKVYFGGTHQYFGPFIAHAYCMSMRLYAPFGLHFPAQEMKRFDYILTFTMVVLVTRFTWYYIVGESVATYQVLYYGRFRYETYIRSLMHEMQAKHVSAPLMTRVHLYCRNLALLVGNNVQFPNFVKDSPYYLREALLDSMFGYHLRQHPVLRRCHADFLRQMAATLETLYFFKNDYVAFIGDIDAKMYFLHEGEIEGLVEDNLMYDVSDSRYVTGDHFGFDQLIGTRVGHKRTYKVTSEKVVLLYLQRRPFLELLDFFPASKHIVFGDEQDGGHDGASKYDEMAGAQIEFRDYVTYTKQVHR